MSSESPNSNKSGAIAVTAAILTLILLLSLVANGTIAPPKVHDEGRSAPMASTDQTRPMARPQTDTPRADAFASGSGAYMNDRAKQVYENDPSSMGYTGSDRQFLKEHGMTESEARATETVLHQHGVD